MVKMKKILVCEEAIRVNQQDIYTLGETARSHSETLTQHSADIEELKKNGWSETPENIKDEILEPATPEVWGFYSGWTASDGDPII